MSVYQISSEFFELPLYSSLGKVGFEAVSDLYSKTLLTKPCFACFSIFAAIITVEEQDGYLWTFRKLRLEPLDACPRILGIP